MIINNKNISITNDKNVDSTNLEQFIKIKCLRVVIDKNLFKHFHIEKCPNLLSRTDINLSLYTNLFCINYLWNLI